MNQFFIQEFLIVNDYFSNEFSIIFIALGIFSLSIPFVPFLQSLIRHGKRLTVKQSDSQHEKGISQESMLLSVPKSFFVHMYIVGLVINTCCCYLAIDIAAVRNPIYQLSDILDSVSIQCVLMFEIHCFRRLLECLYVTNYGSSTMDISGYLVGIMHYVLTPCCLFSSILRQEYSNIKSDSSLQNYLRIFSLFLFIAANISQFQCHRILFNLKCKKEKSKLCIRNTHSCSSNPIPNSNDSGSSKSNSNSSSNSNISTRSSYDSCSKSDLISLYSFPHGYGFNHVACPHYFAEIMIYTSFGMLFTDSLPFLSVWFWVICNLSVSSMSQYDWYKKHFSEEVKKRRNWKRIFPGFW